MPWSNQSGGPRKPTPGPWGQGPNGGATPPDLEDLLRRGQDKLRSLIPGGGSFTGRGIIALVLVGILVWLLSGFYTVQTNEVGLNFVFGRYTGKTSAGLNYNFPEPIGSYQRLEVTDRNAIDIGSSSLSDDSRRGFSEMREVPEESLMLTGDENIADVKFRVIWQIDPVHPEDFAFNIRNPQDTVKAVAESAMRTIVGQTEIQKLLTVERKNIEPEAQAAIQKILDQYKAGVLIINVQLLSVDPPPSVISAFRDVTAAQQDLQRLTNEAETYANRIVPEARGAAAAILQAADGYREQTIAEARGQASAFDQIYAAYKEAPQLTRERMYLETMEKVLGSADKIILDDKGNGVVPYLPLTEVAPKPASQGAAK